MEQTTIGINTEPLLEKLRNEINAIDMEILELLGKRQVLAQQIGAEKKRLGLEVTDTAREQEVIQKLAGRCQPLLDSHMIKAIFREIISAARSVQGQISICYLGPEGSFCQEAALYLFGNSARFLPGSGVGEVFSMVEKGRCSVGVVPIENSYQGSVGETLDLMYDYDLKIVAEVYLRIRHHLLSKESRMDLIKKVYSHPMALRQCKTWIRDHMSGVEIHEAASTSEAARLAAEHGGVGAIASKTASRVYGLNMLAQGIEDQPNNITRFLAISKERARKAPRNKTSFLFALPHKAGSLSRAISPLAQRGINMTRIESRPAKQKKWEYLFFVDIEGHREEPDVDEAITAMEEVCSYFKNLGSYPAGGEEL